MNGFDEHAAESNARQLAEAIDELQELAGKREFQEEAKSVQQLFNSLRPLARDEREALWSRYQECWNNHKTLRHEQAQKREESEQARREIEGEMYVDTNPDREDPTDMQMFMAPFTVGLSIMGQPNDWESMASKIAAAKGHLDEIENKIRSDSRLLPRDRHELFQKLHDLRDHVFQARNSAWDELKGEAEQLYNEAHDAIESMSPRDALEVFKRNQALINSSYMRPDDKQKLRNWFADLWYSLQAKFDDQRREREKRQTDWRERQEAGLERLRQARERKEDYIDKIEQNIAANEERLANAWSDDYRERYSEWIREDEDKLSEAQQELSDLNSKIDDAENRLQH